jgi:hypothetical protein
MRSLSSLTDVLLTLDRPSFSSGPNRTLFAVNRCRLGKSDSLRDRPDDDSDDIRPEPDN